MNRAVVKGAHEKRCIRGIVRDSTIRFCTPINEYNIRSDHRGRNVEDARGFLQELHLIFMNDRLGEVYIFFTKTGCTFSIDFGLSQPRTINMSAID